MRKERINTLTDSFVDESGNTRHFVVAAISELLPEHSVADINGYIYEKLEEFGLYSYEKSQSIVKGLKIGFAICNPSDTFNEELGKQIATGRARKNAKYALFSSELGFINNTMVEALLKQEAEYFKRNPDKWIKGYERTK